MCKSPAHVRQGHARASVLTAKVNDQTSRQTYVCAAQTNSSKVAGQQDICTRFDPNPSSLTLRSIQLLWAFKLLEMCFGSAL